MQSSAVHRGFQSAHLCTYPCTSLYLPLPWPESSGGALWCPLSSVSSCLFISTSTWCLGLLVFPLGSSKHLQFFFCLRCWSYRRLAQVHPCILEIKPWISAHNIIPIDHVVTQSTKIYHFPYTDLSQFLHSTSQEHTMQQYQITILSQAYISNTCTLPMP